MSKNSRLKQPHIILAGGEQDNIVQLENKNHLWAYFNSKSLRNKLETHDFYKEDDNPLLYGRVLWDHVVNLKNLQKAATNYETDRRKTNLKPEEVGGTSTESQQGFPVEGGYNSREILLDLLLLNQSKLNSAENSFCFRTRLNSNFSKAKESLSRLGSPLSFWTVYTHVLKGMPWRHGPYSVGSMYRKKTTGFLHIPKTHIDYGEGFEIENPEKSINYYNRKFNRYVSEFFPNKHVLSSEKNEFLLIKPGNKNLFSGKSNFLLSFLLTPLYNSFLLEYKKTLLTRYLTLRLKN